MTTSAEWPHHRRYPARGSPPGAHRYPPRYAPPAARRARRYARVPPMDSGDEPLPMIKRGPFSMPMGGPFSTPIDTEKLVIALDGRALRASQGAPGRPKAGEGEEHTRKTTSQGRRFRHR